MTPSARRVVGLAAKLAVLVLIGGVVVVGVGAAAGVLGLPNVESVDNTFGNVTDETTEIRTSIQLSNPNPFGVDLESISVEYSAAMNDVPMADGRIDRIAVDTGNSTIDVTTTMDNGAIPAWWTTHIDRGERTDVDVDARVLVDQLDRGVSTSRTHPVETDMLGSFSSDEQRPINAELPLVSDPILYINETSASWADVAGNETALDKQLVVYNPKSQPYVVSELRYELTMNGITVGEGATEDPVVIGPGEEETIEATTAIQADTLDEWWVTHLDEDVHGHQASELRIDFWVTIELPTGDEISVPADELAYEERIETDLFDEGLHDAESTDEPDEDRNQKDDETADADDGADDGTPADEDGTGTDDVDDDSAEDDGTGSDGGDDDTSDEDTSEDGSETDDGNDDTDDSTNDDGTGDDSADDGTDDDGTDGGAADDQDDDDGDDNDDDGDDGVLPL